MTTSSLEFGLAGRDEATLASWIWDQHCSPDSCAIPLRRVVADLTLYSHSSFFWGSVSASFLFPFRALPLLVAFLPCSLAARGVAQVGVAVDVTVGVEPEVGGTTKVGVATDVGVAGVGGAEGISSP